MKISIKKNELLSYTVNQLNNIFPINKIKNKDILHSFNIALERTEKCFDSIDLKLKYYIKKLCKGRGCFFRATRAGRQGAHQGV